MEVAADDAPEYLSASTMGVERQRRISKILADGVASFCVRIVSFAVTIIQVRLATLGLGAEKYGVWLAVLGWLAMAGVVELGIGSSVQNIASRLSVRNQAGALMVWVTTAATILTLVVVSCGAVMLAAGCGALRLGFISVILGVNGAPGWLPSCFFWGVAGFCLTVISSLFVRVAYGLGKIVMVNIATVIGGALGVGGLYLAHVCNAEPKWYFAILGVQPAVAGYVVLSVMTATGDLRGIRPLGTGTMRRCRLLLGRGVRFLFPNVAAAGIGSVPLIALAPVVGASDVAVWGVGNRLLGILLGTQQSFLMPVWPALTMARAEGKTGWIAKAVVMSSIGSVAAFALPMCLFRWWGPTAVNLWTKGSITLPPNVAAGLGLYCALQAVAQPATILLNSHGRTLGQGLYGSACALIMLLSIGVVAGKSGLAGGCWLCALVFGLIVLPGVWVEAILVCRNVKWR